MPLKSLIAFLILAWVIISWPFRMPPRSSPMMTSTIAISTRVKPVSVDFLRLKADAFIRTSKASYSRSIGRNEHENPSVRLVILAQQILIYPGFHVGRGRVYVCERIRGGLQLRADLAGRRTGVVHLGVHRGRHFFRQIREAHDQAGEAQAAYADRAVLHADHAPCRVRWRRPAPGSRGQARDEAGDAQMLPK